jgi:hypothetical protein
VETPYPKKVQRLPTVLSQEEVSQLINAAPTPFYRILLMTLYAIPYVHVIFTVPRRLAPLALRNKKVIYDLLFRTCAETLLEVARDPCHLGGEIGFFGVLHSWNQKLEQNPHS